MLLLWLSHVRATKLLRCFRIGVCLEANKKTKYPFISFTVTMILSSADFIVHKIRSNEPLREIVGFFFYAEAPTKKKSG